MNLLAIDTALENCAVGLAAGEKVTVRVQTIGRGHSELLMTELAALFDEAGIAPAAVERIAVSVGPGSFTGLRVGIAAARGLALVHRAAVVGVPTLQVHAARAAKLGSGGRPILALLPARGEELYGQLFSADGDPLEAASVANAGHFAARIAAEGLAAAGAGAALAGVAAPIHADSAPSIETLLALGARLDPDAFPPKPLYVKPPDAAPAPASARIARQ